MPSIQAITFDLWDTIVDDDSDEKARAAAGLRSKLDERRHVLSSAGFNEQSALDKETVVLAYNVADAAFNRVWKRQSVTWPIADRIDVILQGLGRSLPEAALAEVIDAHERMEVDIPPNLIDGCDAALAQLSQQYALAIVSDAIVTPGRCLRELLEKHRVKKYFSGFAFSDEVGYSKPHRSMFATAAEQLGVPIESMVHIGDRDHNDVRGAHAHGMKAVLFTATRDVDRDRSKADAICERYADLPGIVERLAAE